MRLFLLAFCFCLNFVAHASRGWYVTIAGLTTKQDHTVADRKITTNVYNNNSKTFTQNYSVVNANPQNTTYWFKSDSTNQDSANALAPFSNLSGEMSGKYITTNPVNFSLYTDVTDGTSPPKFATVPAGFTVAENTSPTNTTGGNIPSAIITHDATGTQVAKIDRVVGTSDAKYSVSLKAIDWSSQIASIKSQVESEVNASSSLLTTNQLQNFLDTAQSGFKPTIEIGIGYKFRPFQYSWFLAPQIEITYFKSNGQNTNVYANYSYTGFSKNKEGTYSNNFSHDALDLSFAATLSTRIGIENNIFIMNTKIPFSLYGIVGGTSAMRKYKEYQAGNLGFRYGVGGEIFLSKKMALFAEFFQTRFITQTIDLSTSSKYKYSTEVNNIINSNTGGTITLENSAQTKSTVANYANLGQSVSNINYDVNEFFKITTKLVGIKLGLAYYL